MQILDNVNSTVREDLKKIMRKGSKVSIAAACFSIYAYQELKKQLEGVAKDKEREQVVLQMYTDTLLLTVKRRHWESRDARFTFPQLSAA